MQSKEEFIKGIKKRAEILKKFGNYDPMPRKRKVKPLTIEDIPEVKIDEEELEKIIILEKEKEDDPEISPVSEV